MNDVNGCASVVVGVSAGAVRFVDEVRVCAGTTIDK
jgi:hypothetical protein